MGVGRTLGGMMTSIHEALTPSDGNYSSTDRSWQDFANYCHLVRTHSSQKALGRQPYDRKQG